jgi:superfamily II DNA/RNA helicase
VALVSGSYTQTTFGRNDYDSILTNFSPRSKKRSMMKSASQDGEVDILIATDCISEGQNLQDCDYLINYDIHWNPVRIIQRFGRIDRLGSINKQIQLVNFWPTKDLDNYINLKERVEARMALVDVTATGEDNILNVEQIEELISEDLKYRNRQLKKMKEEVLDLEDMEETVSITDFTLDDFRIELLNYIDANRKKLEAAPFGLYAVVPSPSGSQCDKSHADRFTQAEKAIIKPGVVFCLRQKGDTGGNKALNPLQPYFLVYIRNDGTVRYNYVNAKQILEIYRLMCQERREPYEKICELFNGETQNGEEMGIYAEMLKKAVTEIARIFKKRATQKLTMDRGALIIPKAKQPNDMENFELVTWLVVR